MKEKIVLIGAGSAMFTRGLVVDMARRGIEGELALVDIDPAALETVERLTRKILAALGSGLKISAEIDRRDALKAASAVICTIGVGGRRAWERDVFIPRKYGIFQPVGDSVMPGGTSRALRMIPAMVAIAGDVMDLAPEAMFFNYGNPMSATCRGVRKATGANMVGLCHGVHHVSQYLAGTLGVRHDEFKYAAAGMNHMTWFTEMRVNGRDAIPQLREIAAKRLRAAPGENLGREFAEAGNAKRNATPADDNPFCWRLFTLFNAFPAVFDRHVAEFFPQFFAREASYYGNTLGKEAFSFEQTIAHGDEIYAQMREDAASGKPLGEDYFKTISGEHEQVIEIIESIRSDAGRVYSANVPNRGQIPNLPENAVVECPAVACGAGLRPIMQPAMPPGVAGVLATRFQWVETVVEAAIEGSRDKFIQALALDGAADSLDTACRMADELIEAQKEFLPRFNV